MNDTPPKNQATQTSYAPLRIFALIFALLLSVPALLLLLAVFSHSGFDVFSASLDSSFVAAAFICWWMTLRGNHAKSRRRILFAASGAVIVGGISFAAGFFGPIIFAPDANQGPLLGIFITGPLGFAVGTGMGTIVGYWCTCKITD